MTEITIKANGKPHFHYKTDRDLTDEELNREPMEDKRYWKKDVEYDVKIKRDKPYGKS
jgi:hypothetical protein